MNVDTLNKMYLVGTLEIARLIRRAATRFSKAMDLYTQIIQHEVMGRHSTINPGDIGTAIIESGEHLAEARNKTTELIKMIEESHAHDTPEVRSTNWITVGTSLSGKASMIDAASWKTITSLAIQEGIKSYVCKMELKLTALSHGTTVVLRSHQKCELQYQHDEIRHTTVGDPEALADAFARQSLRYNSLNAYMLTMQMFERELRRRAPSGHIFAGFIPQPA